MASQRTFAANNGLKLTPGTNSPYSRTPRSPNKPRPGLYESGLSLRKIIGTTVSSPTAFDSLLTSPIFAYTAGAAACVITLPIDADDESATYSQRFFRARPTAVPSPISVPAGAPSTPTPNDGRSRVGNIRDTAVPYSPSTPHTGLDWGDSPTSKTWTSRERIKAATCLSLSRDARYIAVGETGYAPRVLIFSLQDASSDTPLAILNEHTFGVRAVAFSSDQKYLASLGLPNDGFLYVWSINQRTGAPKIHSSNKCTTSIKQMIWLGSSIVTVGTRHVKVWRVEDSRSMSPTKPKFALDGTPQPVPVQPALKTLAGRNVLLGPLVESTFTAICAISDFKAIVCSEKGDVCLLDDDDGQRLLRLTNVGFSITCIAVDSLARRIRIGGKNGQVKSMCLDDLLYPSTPPPESDASLSANISTTNEIGHLCAMGYAGSTLITMDSKHMIEISSIKSDLENPKMLNAPFPSHGDAVLGVRLLNEPNSFNATFLTWSADGTVAFWDLNGIGQGLLKTEVEQISSSTDEMVNQCLVVRASKGSVFLVTGDRYGVMRIVNTADQTCAFDARAHSSDIHDIAIFESETTCMVASCGRDRVIQLFRCVLGQWSLIQTLDDHAASVGGLIFAENGEKLISFSTDRTIHVRQLVKKEVDGVDVIGAIPVRIITLKAAPVSMVACLDDSVSNFVVSLLDRTVATYDIVTGRLVSSFRVSDGDGSEAVVLDALRIGMPGPSGRPTILAGVSGTDKSVRIYDAGTGSFLDREWGHTAAITDVALLEVRDSDQKTLISTGSDGTIMIWDLSPRPPEIADSAEIVRNTSPPKEATPARQPLRRVLSRAEIAEFQRASPVTTPTGRSSPPRVIRRKTSKYGLAAQSPALMPPMPLMPSKYFTSTSEDSSSRKGSPRNRSRSPPPSPKGREARRPSLADSRNRTRSTGNFSDFGTLNMATEQASRTLRAYRKKLLTSELIRDETIKELEQELRLTAVALGERSQKSKAISETVLTGLLDQYSSRLVSMFDEKLKLTNRESNSSAELDERPKTAGGPMISQTGDL